jgi:serine/threonine-protein kinase ULK/ATG1
MEDISNYSIIRKLGSGTFGEAFLMNGPEGKKYVVKKIANDENAVHEAAILDTMRPFCNDGLLCFKTFITDNENAYIITDYLEDSYDLYGAIKLNFHLFDTEMKLEIILNMVSGLMLLHENNIVHRDVKPANMLFINDGSLKVHYIDFGTACTKDNVDCLNRNTGSPSYVDPHIFGSRNNTYESVISSDIWSLGVSIYFVLYGKLPWASAPSVPALLFQIIRKGNIETSDSFSSIINPILKINPQDRISLGDLLLNVNSLIGEEKEEEEEEEIISVQQGYSLHLDKNTQFLIRQEGLDKTHYQIPF